MKKNIILFVSIAILASCVPAKQLYSWENYGTTSYNYLKNSDEESLQKLIENYQIVIDKQKGTRGVVPPGVYADLGFLLLQNGETDEGKVMLQKEIDLYPESKIFIDRVLKMMEE